MLRPALVLLSVLPIASAQASLAGPRLFPRGARAPGFQETGLDTGGLGYLFTLRDQNGAVVVQYRLPLRHPNMLRGLLRVEETTTGVVPIAGGGLSYRTQAPGPSDFGQLIAPYDLAFAPAHDPQHTAQLLAHGLDAATGVVTVRYRDTYQSASGPIATEKTYALRLRGRSLEIRATGDLAVRSLAAFNYAGFQFGQGEGLPLPSRVLHVPYMDMFPVFAGGAVRVTRIQDWYRSNASDTVLSMPPAVNGARFDGESAPAYYRNDQGELLAAVDETVFVTVSREIGDTFPVVDRPPSPYRQLLASRMVSQNAPGNRYAPATAWVRRALDLGLTEMAHIKWDWSKWPFNLNDPDLFPAPTPPFGTLWGSEAEWRGYANACARGNWNLCPYFTEDSNDPGYPNLLLQLPGSNPGSVLLTPNPVYDPLRNVRDANGNPKKGWDTNANLAGSNLAGQGHPVDLIGSQFRALNFQAYAARIHQPDGFPVSGLHIDAATDLPCWNHIDQRKLSGFPHTVAETLMGRERSFLAGKDGMQGPLFGENAHWRARAFESYQAGLVDGTSRKIPIHWSPLQGPPDAPNWDAQVIPDFELSEVLTKASGFFGMGWESHFLFNGYPVDDTFVDAWHTTLLSYGHAPYVGTNGDVPNNYWEWRRTVRSSFLTYGVSQRMRSSRIQQVRYVDATLVERTLDEALALGLDLNHPRLVLRFANGLEFKANHAAGSWSTTVLGQGHVLPVDGWAAAAPDGLLALSALNPVGGARVDYAFNPGHSEMIDRRGAAQGFAGFPGTLLPVPPGLFNPPVNELDLVVVKDLRRNVAVYASGFQTAVRPLGAEPSLVALQVVPDDTTTLSLGRLRLGLRAVATDQNGNTRDVTGLVAWTSSNAPCAAVNRWGGVHAAGAGGSALITATLASPALGASATVQATALPVLEPLVIQAVTGTTALLRFATDADCPITVVLYLRAGSGIWEYALGRSDPPRKDHSFALTGLVPGSSYTVVPFALNEFLLLGAGAAVVLNTP